MKAGLIKDNDTWQQLNFQKKVMRNHEKQVILESLCKKQKGSYYPVKHLWRNLLRKKLRTKAVNYFFKQASAQIFETILNTPLTEGLFYAVLKFFIFPKILRCRSLRFFMGQFLNTFATDDNPFSSKFLPLAR